MGRKFTKFMALALTMTLSLSACGVNTATGGKGSEASGSAVSGAAAISGSAVSEERGTDVGRTSFSEKALWNSTNYYEEYESDDADSIDADTDLEGLTQYNRNGKKVQDIIFAQSYEEEGEHNWLFLEENKLIFSVYDYVGETDKEVVTFYELPLYKGKDGNDVVEPEKKQKLFEIEDAYDEIYVDSRYIIGAGEHNKKIFRYERESGKLVWEEPLKPKKGESISLEIMDQSLGTQEIYVTVHKEPASGDHVDNLYCQNLDTMEWKELIEEPEGDICYIYYDAVHVSDRVALLCAVESHGPSTKEDEMRNVYYLRNIENDTAERVASGELCRELLIKEKAAGEQELKMCDMGGLLSEDILYDYRGYSDGKIYLDAVIETQEQSTTLARRAVFSVGEEDGILRYEKKLSEHMWELGTYKHIKEPGDENHVMRANLAQCFVKDQEALITYETKEGVKAVLYNLTTGEDREYSKRDKKWRTFHDVYEDMKIWVDNKTSFLTAFYGNCEDDIIYEEGSPLFANSTGSDSAKQYPLANDKVVLVEDYSGDEDGVWLGLDGKGNKYTFSGSKEIQKKLHADKYGITIDWITNDWLYFVWEPEDSDKQKTNGGFCRVPLTVEKNEVKIDAEKIETLHQFYFSSGTDDEQKEEDDISSMAVTEDMVIFDVPYREDDDEPYIEHSQYFCYDLKEKKESRILEDVVNGLELYIVTDEMTDMPLIMDGCFVFARDPAVYGEITRELYLVNPKTFETRKIYEEKSKQFEGLKPYSTFRSFHGYGDTLYFVKDNQEGQSLVQVNVRSGKEAKVLTGEAIKNYLEEAGLFAQKDVSRKHAHVLACYVDGDILYLEGDAEWSKKEIVPNGAQKGKEIERLYDRNFLLKYSLSKNEDIASEGAWKNCKELTDYMYENSSHKKTYQQREGYDEYKACEGSDILFVWKGNAILSMSDETGDDLAFSLEDGKILDVKKVKIPLSMYSYFS